MGRAGRQPQLADPRPAGGRPRRRARGPRGLDGGVAADPPQPTSCVGPRGAAGSGVVSRLDGFACLSARASGAWLGMPSRLSLLLVSLASLAACKDGTGPAYPSEIKLPKGFKIAVYAEVPYARSMTLGADGTVYVGSKEGDAVHAVRDEDGDHVGESVAVVASDLDTPNGVAWRDGDL